MVTIPSTSPSRCLIPTQDWISLQSDTLGILGGNRGVVRTRRRDLGEYKFSVWSKPVLSRAEISRTQRYTKKGKRTGADDVPLSLLQWCPTGQTLSCDCKRMKSTLDMFAAIISSPSWTFKPSLVKVAHVPKETRGAEVAEAKVGREPVSFRRSTRLRAGFGHHGISNWPDNSNVSSV